MKSVDNINNLADLLELKLVKQAQQVSQTGTTELFFDNEGKQSSFANAIQDPNGSVYKTLLSVFNKNGGKAVSFSLKMSAVPKKGASWILTTNPANIRSGVAVALDSVFQKVMGQTMAVKLKSADAKAKAGGGSGPLNVGALDLAP